jgi:hypothetical protein
MRGWLTFITVAVLATTTIGTANAAQQPRPRAGSYSGQEANGTTPVPVSFTVSKNRNKVVGFSGQAVVKVGCKNHIRSFEAPHAAMAIKGGRFSGSSTSYPQKGVRVVVTARFTSQVKAKGRIAIRFSRVKRCTVSRSFTAERVS